MDDDLLKRLEEAWSLSPLEKKSRSDFGANVARNELFRQFEEMYPDPIERQEALFRWLYGPTPK